MKNNIKLIVGLGNVGKKYEGTRHNVGFLAVDAFRELLCDDEFKLKERFNCWVCENEYAGGKVILAKPTKYMNLSGYPVKLLADYYNIDSADILVIHDDLDLELGEVRFKHGGGTGGHHGLQSVHENLGTDEYDRCRIGIGKKGQAVLTEKEGADFVLGRFTKEEELSIKKALETVLAGGQCWLTDGIEECMNKYN